MENKSQTSCYSKSKIFDKEVSKVTRFFEKMKLVQIKSLLTNREVLTKEYVQKKSELRKNQALEECRQVNMINQAISNKFIIDSVQDTETSESVPAYWMKCMEGSCRFDFVITRSDKLALNYITNILINEQLHGFTIKYCFDQNPYFANLVLEKCYTLNENYTIRNIDSTKILWNSDEVNLTLKEENGSYFPVVHSFFNSFTSFSISSNNHDLGSSDFGVLFTDGNDCIDEEFSFGLFIKNDFLPKSILYYMKSVIRANKSKNSQSKVEDDSFFSLNHENSFYDEALTTENVTQETLKN